MPFNYLNFFYHALASTQNSLYFFVTLSFSRLVLKHSFLGNPFLPPSVSSLFLQTFSTIDTWLFADNQAILSYSENRLQMEIVLLNRICKFSGLQTSTRKTKVMAFRGTGPLRAGIIVDGTVLEQVSNFEYLGYSVSYNASNDVVTKLHKFNFMRCV